MELVAKLAKIPRATLYYYFGGKEDLVGFFLSWLNEHVQAVVDEAVAAPGTIRERMQRGLEAGITIGNVKPQLDSAYLAVLTESRVLGPGLVELGDVGFAPIKHLLEEAEEAGILTVDTEIAHNIVWGTCVIMFLKDLVAARRPDEERLRATISATLDALLKPEVAP